jgi:PAS domain S-box-containing protein
VTKRNKQVEVARPEREQRPAALEPALVAEQERLRYAHEAARLISWDWDPLADRVERPYGAALGAATGITEGASLDTVLRHVAAPFRRTLQLQLEAVVAGHGECAVQYPLVGSRQEATWVETRASMSSPDSGTPLLLASTRDITDAWRSREALEAARIFWQATLESLPAHVAVIAADGEIIAVNEAWSEFARAQGGVGVGVGANYLDVCDAGSAAGDADAALVAAALRAILRGDEVSFGAEYRCTTPQEELSFALRASRFRGPGPDRVVVQHLDITHAERTRADIQTQARLLDAVDASVIASDLNGLVTHWNDGAARLYGWSAEEAVGQDVNALVVGERDVPASSEVRHATATHGNWEAEVEVQDKAGATFPVYVRSAVLLGDRGNPIGRVSVSVDVSERVEGERRLRSAESYLRAVTDSMGEGLMTLDGDGRLSYMNHAALELLGWDRSDIESLHAHMIIANVRDHGSPFPLEQSATTQSSTPPAAVRVEDDVFTRRDGTSLPVSYTASPFASSEGDAGWVVLFSDITARKVQQARMRQQLEALSWVNRIRDALANDAFSLVAQPIVEIGSGRVVQHELLLRMRGEHGEAIPPGDFLPAAETSGLIGDVDRWVLTRGIALAAAGHAVEINISGASLGGDELFEFVRDRLASSNADPTLVVFELTETAVLQNEDAAQAFIERVSLLGCRVALDDFGTGYGGFTYLKRLPVHYLKIDREFVLDLLDNAASRHVVQAVVALARGFGLKTVAEGVESQAALKQLTKMGVDYAQGFAIGRPRPVDAVFGAMATTDTKADAA